MKQLKQWGVVAALLMAVAIVLGALGAHSLKPHLSVDQLNSFETGVRYHLIHGVAMIVLVVGKVGDIKWRKRALFMMLAGVVFFSFSIYLLSLKDLLGIASWSKVLGPVTPLGGICFIIAWISTAVDLGKLKSVH